MGVLERWWCMHTSQITIESSPSTIFEANPAHRRQIAYSAHVSHHTWLQVHITVTERCQDYSINIRYSQSTAVRTVNTTATACAWTVSALSKVWTLVHLWWTSLQTQQVLAEFHMTTDFAQRLHKESVAGRSLVSTLMPHISLLLPMTLPSTGSSPKL